MNAKPRKAKERSQTKNGLPLIPKPTVKPQKPQRKSNNFDATKRKKK